MTLDELHFDERGLIPAVVQEAATGELLMVAWMNRVALDATLATGRSHFWSRSRETLWQKGESSGHVQHVDGVYVDCDADTLLVQVHQEGPACHTGHRTCFFRRIVDTERGPASLRGWGVSDARDVVPGVAPAIDEAAAAAQMLERLDRIVAQRKASPPAGSYVAGLLAKGEAAICRKIGEEATEVIIAALGGEGDRRLVEELADLWFHTLVLLGQRGLSARDILEELARRHATRAAAGG